MQEELLSGSRYVLLSDLAKELKVPAYRLRSWEVLYPFIKSIRDASGRRFYDQKNVELFKEISRLLYQEGRKTSEISAILTQKIAKDAGSSPLEARDATVLSTFPEISKEDGNFSLKIESLSQKHNSLKNGVEDILLSLKKLGQAIASAEKL